MMENKLIQISNFDSDILNKKVAKLNFSDVDFNLNSFIQIYKDFIKKNDIEMAICSSQFNFKTIRFLESENYKLISTKVLYKLDLKKIDFEKVKGFLPKNFLLKTDVDYKFNSFNDGIVDLVEDLWKTSHYWKDNEIDRIKSHLIYDKWFENTFKGYANKVFVLLDKDFTSGILSLKEVKGNFFIDLLGVHKNYRGIGLARVLFELAVLYVKKTSNSMYVFTQGENFPANRFYQKNNFLLETFGLIYHKNFV